LGRPDRFLGRIEDAGSILFGLGPYRGGDFSTGIDNQEMLDALPKNYSADIWTNEIEETPRLRGRK
jgi:glycerophosphoryl diester phosphodiesterase